MSKQVQQIMKDRSASNANSEAVKVVIRCRPLSEKEMAAGHDVVVDINNKTGEIFIRKPGSDETPKQFTFDMAFGWNAEQV